MDDIFAGPFDLMQSAKGHIEEIISILEGVFHEDWATIVKEGDPESGETVFKVAFNTPVPIRVATRVFNVVTELRSALDHAVYAATVALGSRSDPGKAKFPFGETASDFEQDLMRGAEHVTTEIFDVLIALKPYKAGNRMLWSLNKLRNVKDHRKLIIPAPIARVIDAEATDGRNSNSGPIVLSKRAGPDNDFVIARAPGDAQGKLNIGVILCVAFGEVEAVKGLDPTGYLIKAHEEVGKAISAIEQATVRALDQRRRDKSRVS